eukprot:8015860-Pyramimonas_sp.AAC.1
MAQEVPELGSVALPRGFGSTLRCAWSTSTARRDPKIVGCCKRDVAPPCSTQLSGWSSRQMRGRGCLNRWSQPSDSSGMLGKGG